VEEPHWCASDRSKHVIMESGRRTHRHGEEHERSEKGHDDQGYHHAWKYNSICNANRDRVMIFITLEIRLVLACVVAGSSGIESAQADLMQRCIYAGESQYSRS
jgi:hypothetical protein